LATFWILVNSDAAIIAGFISCGALRGRYGSRFERRGQHRRRGKHHGRSVKQFAHLNVSSS
jgi:hypothetical protein